MKSTRFLKEAFERAPSRSAVEVDGELIARWADRWLKDKEQSIASIRVVDRNQSRVELADVEWDIWKRVHDEGLSVVCQI